MNEDRDIRKSRILIAGVVIAALILVVKLFYLQIVDEEYKISAENNAYKYAMLYPVRGAIFDRNKELLVGNKNSYDLLVTPMEVSEFDTLSLCRIFDLDKDEVVAKFAQYRKDRRKIGFQSLTFLKHISAEQYGVYAEQAYRFPGFSIVSKTSREYMLNAGANLWGYVTEVSPEFLKEHPEYKMGDYVGATGLEKAYEEHLRGEKGYNIYLRDVHNKVRSSFANGAYDKKAVAGENLVTTIDAHLQQYGETLMQNKVGSAIAIEPSTGEILAIVSSPGIDIDKLANIGKYYREIANDPYKPMFNRAVMSAYPPGSVFKLVNGLIALQDGVIVPETRFPCSMGYHYAAGKKLGCHAHPSPLDFRSAIMMSCNAYFCYAFKAILENKKFGRNIYNSFNHWRTMVESFGFGHRLGSDIPAELGGNLPKTSNYDKIHGRNQWNATSIISLSIGQGEIGTTPLHLANLAAIMANRGYFYTPHLIKYAQALNDIITIDEGRFAQRHYTLVDTTWFPVAVDGMYRAVNSPPGAGGTARRAAVEGLDICGKTGTAQNPHGKDNSVFICFAPKDNPRIAVAVYLENAGFGGTWAAPLASLMVEKYLKGEVERKDLERDILEANLIVNVPVKRK